MMKRLTLSLVCGLLGWSPYGMNSTSAAPVQFTGPAPTGKASTVEQAKTAPVYSYVTVTGNIVAHLREDYYSFRDDTGEIRVEIEPKVWNNRQVGPSTRVRLLAEVDRNPAGAVYLWVKSLEIVN